MTSSVSEVDDLLTEKFPPLPPTPAADLPPAVDEPPPVKAALASALSWSGRPGAVIVSMSSW